MSNRTNHKYERSSNEAEYCSKCDIGFEYLLTEAFKINANKKIGEIFGDFVNRVNPCLTDEEILIKKALE